MQMHKKAFSSDHISKFSTWEKDSAPGLLHNAWKATEKPAPEVKYVEISVKTPYGWQHGLIEPELVGEVVTHLMENLNQIITIRIGERH